MVVQVLVDHHLHQLVSWVVEDLAHSQQDVQVVRAAAVLA
jgi:hypothetical protein